MPPVKVTDQRENNTLPPIKAITQPFRGKLFHLSLLLLLTFISGCALHAPPKERVPGESPPKIVQSLTATATVTVARRGKSDLRGRALITVEKPAHFRIEVFGPFHQTVLIVTGDGETLSLLDVSRETLHRWPVRRSPFPFTGSEVTSSLLGIFPGADGHGTDEGEEERRYTREDPTGGTIRIDMADYRLLHGISLPYSITMASRRGTLSLAYKKVTLNAPTDDVDFTLTAPEGFVEHHDR